MAYGGVFACVLTCCNDDCGERVAVAGRSEAGEEGEYLTAVTSLQPLLFTPALELLRIPAECPPPVVCEFQRAFAVYWSDRTGALNHLRKAVELILDRLKIPRLLRAKGKRLSRLPLQERIKRFHAKDPSLAARLEAVKWLGNRGSHEPEVSQDAFFNACDLLEDFICTHFEKRGQKTVALTNRVIRRKGRD